MSGTVRTWGQCTDRHHAQQRIRHQQLRQSVFPVALIGHLIDENPQWMIGRNTAHRPQQFGQARQVNFQKQRMLKRDIANMTARRVGIQQACNRLAHHHGFTHPARPGQDNRLLPVMLFNCRPEPLEKRALRQIMDQIVRHPVPPRVILHQTVQKVLLTGMFDHGCHRHLPQIFRRPSRVFGDNAGENL